MNRRILKKKCKQAMALLIAKHGFKLSDFKMAEGNESIDAPRGMKGRGVRPCIVEGHDIGGWLEPGPLKGTPLLWQGGGESNEWDVVLPIYMAEQCEFFANATPEELAEFGRGTSEQPFTYEPTPPRATQEDSDVEIPY